VQIVDQGTQSEVAGVPADHRRDVLKMKDRHFWSVAHLSDGKIGASVVVSYRHDELGWNLTVCDNGVGNGAIQPLVRGARLGARIVELLAKQLNAQVATLAGPGGTTVSVTHAETSPGLRLI
jgi:hypothetical protein